MSDKQPFEAHPELANIIEWFANNVPCPGTEWNKLLREINGAVAPSPSGVDVLVEALEQIFDIAKGCQDFYKPIEDVYKIAKLALSQYKSPSQSPQTPIDREPEGIDEMGNDPL